MLNLLLLLALCCTVEGQSIIITNQPVNQTVWGGCYATFSVGVSNADAYSYQWLLNNTNLPDNILITMVGGANDKFLNGYPIPSIDSGWGVAPDAAGNVYFSDLYGGRIYKLNTNNYTIQLVAGGGSSMGTDVATNENLSNPASLAVDKLGNLFIADGANSRICKVDTNGIISTVAGNGSSDYTGDGGQATNASLSSPVGVAVDGFGNLFIADTGNQCIRKVASNGIITTIAGRFSINGGFSGDGGAATNAEMSFPLNVTTDAEGNLFVADAYNNRIRKIGTNGIINTVAGSGPVVTSYGTFSGDGGAATNANLYSPWNMVVDAGGNLFIADTGNNRIRKVDTNGIITTIAGGGSSADDGDATNVSLPNPTNITFDSKGTMIVANSTANPGSFRLSKIYDTHKPAFIINTKPAQQYIFIHITPDGPVLVNEVVPPLNAGTYQVIISGTSGSVTSSVVNLTVTTTPQITQAVRNANGNMVINFLSKPNSTNQVICATDLNDDVSEWVPISTNIAGFNSNWQFTDTNAASFPIRFYSFLSQ